MDIYENSLNYTLYFENEFYKLVDSKNFFENDSDTIYKYLSSKMRLVSFGDYLKEYINRLAGFSKSSNEVNLKEYEYIIIEAFKGNHTPASFSETTTPLSTCAKNWLTQVSVKREAVFLLGFGLGMSVEDVSEFLIHGLYERDFNFKNPFEVMCWYCFKNGYKYPKFEQLMDDYKKLPYGDGLLASEATLGVRALFSNIKTESELMHNLQALKTVNEGHFFSVTARACFEELYDKVRRGIARIYTDNAEADAEEKAKEYYHGIKNSVMLSDEEKLCRMEKIRNSYKKYEYEDISGSDVEKFIYNGTPVNDKGNLYKFSKSTLAKHFRNKRLSRQRIHDIFAGETDIDRFDLITLSFFLSGMNLTDDDNKARYFNFVESTNEILDRCFMGKLYFSNPYELFVQMCILSVDPLCSYADVIEMSF